MSAPEPLVLQALQGFTQQIDKWPGPRAVKIYLASVYNGKNYFNRQFHFPRGNFSVSEGIFPFPREFTSSMWGKCADPDFRLNFYIFFAFPWELHKSFTDASTDFEKSVYMPIEKLYGIVLQNNASTFTFRTYAVLLQIEKLILIDIYIIIVYCKLKVQCKIQYLLEMQGIIIWKR